MQQFFKRFAGYSKKRILLGLFLMCGLLYLSVRYNVVLAESTGTAAPKTSVSFEQAFIDIAATLVKYISMLIWVILSYVGKLMDNNYIFKDSMVEMLRTIWLVVRNLTNVGFAIILLGAAFYIVIFGGSEGGVNIKSALPRFVLGLVLVNFSWLGCTLIIDLSSVVTSAVFSIPQSIQTENITCLTIDPTSEKQEEGPCYDVAVIQIDPSKVINQAKISDENKEKNSFFVSATTEDIAKLESENKSGKEITKAIKMGEIATIGYTDLITKDFGASNAAMIMAVNLGGIDSLARASSNLNSKSGLTLNLIFSLGIIIMVIVPLFALCIVLMARMAVLWLCMAFMPLAFLGLVIKGELTTSLTEGMPNLVDHFIKNAFLPAYVAAPFSVGFLMINAAQKLFIQSDILQGQATITVSPTIASVGNLDMILWYLAVAGIIWAGVFTALQGNAITESIVGSIQSGAQGLAKGAASSLTYIPFIPLGKQSSSGKQDVYSLKSLMGVKPIIKGVMDEKAHTGSKSISEKLGVITSTSAVKINLDDFKAKYQNKDYNAQTINVLKNKITDENNKAEDLSSDLKAFLNANKIVLNIEPQNLNAAQTQSVLKQVFEGMNMRTQFDKFESRKDINTIYENVAGKKATGTKEEEKGRVDNAGTPGDGKNLVKLVYGNIEVPGSVDLDVDLLKVNNNDEMSKVQNNFKLAVDSGVDEKVLKEANDALIEILNNNTQTDNRDDAVKLLKKIDLNQGTKEKRNKKK